MNIRSIKQGVALTALLMAANQAGAASFDLCTGTTTKTMPDNTVITMWGYGIDTGSPCVPTVPGPQLTVPAGDNSLTINLRNELTDPVSIVISGQALPESAAGPTLPMFLNGRVRSFTHETTTTGVYRWNNLKPGTYLYSSGTHPAVQVQMGLYGAVTHDAAAGEAYAGISYDSEVPLLYSEIDPALHAAVAGGTYGTASYPSTVNYAPRYFLVNGAPFEPGITPPLSAGTTGGKTLLRFLNAGLEDHAMVLQGQHMTLVAEDGNAYPWPRKQYSVFLAAGKTKDAIFTPGANVSYPVYDRRLRLTNAPGAPGGLQATLDVSAAVPGPVANDDLATVDEDSSGNSISILMNDTPTGNAIDPATVAIGSPAVNGQAIANPLGTVSYTPNPDFSGADGFTYTVRDTAGNISNVATVSITVTPLNDAPVAVDDPFGVAQDSTNNILDVLANDTDVDGDNLTITAVSSVNATTDGSTISYSPVTGSVSGETFTYDISDGNGGSATATVTVTVSAAPGNQPPVANDDYDTVMRNTGASNNSVTIDVVANDTDADGSVAASTVAITADPRKGVAVNNGDGTVTYTPTAGKRGSDAFGYTVMDDLGATSNVATVRVDILK
jgi:FtsP/CotA-like multicopper oxidase with cupredoxin domain